MSDISYIISFSERSTAKTIKRQKVFPYVKSKSHNQYKSHFDLSSYIIFSCQVRDKHHHI